MERDGAAPERKGCPGHRCPIDGAWRDSHARRRRDRHALGRSNAGRRQTEFFGRAGFGSGPARTGMPTGRVAAGVEGWRDVGQAGAEENIIT